ncbi:17727_t:CDS:2, partial [Entrophospora sp. SA101]
MSLAFSFPKIIGLIKSCLFSGFNDETYNECHFHESASHQENEESSTVLETFENAEENTNVEEESADDEIEE